MHDNIGSSHETAVAEVRVGLSWCFKLWAGCLLAAGLSYLSFPIDHGLALIFDHAVEIGALPLIYKTQEEPYYMLRQG